MDALINRLMLEWLRSPCIAASSQGSSCPHGGSPPLLFDGDWMSRGPMAGTPCRTDLFQSLAPPVSDLFVLWPIRKRRGAVSPCLLPVHQAPQSLTVQAHVFDSGTANLALS